MKVVKFDDGTFGVVKGVFFKEFLSKISFTWCYIDEIIPPHCKFECLRDAVLGKNKASTKYIVLDI